MLNLRRPGHDESANIWNSRDDKTLGSREPSLDIQRSNDIDSLKQSLLKRESTRGRRRPGETVPNIPRFDSPTLNVTQPSPRREGFMSSASRALDEEAELGLEPSTSYTGAGFVAPAPQQTTGYSMFPPQRNISQSQRQQGLGLQPLASNAVNQSTSQQGRAEP